MQRNLEDYKEQRLNEIEKLYKTNANLKLKYAATGVIGIAIILMLILAFCMDFISLGITLFLRGCVGLCAIAFVIMVAVLVYRVHRDYFRQHTDKP